MTENRETLAAERAKLRLNMLAGFRKIPKAHIPVIPTERTKFPGTENDYWYKVTFPYNEDITACVYEFGDKSTFPPHFHLDSCEQFILMSKGAKFEIVTEHSESVIEFPSSVFFAKGEKHAIINKTGGSAKCVIIWKPKMDGWEAEFLNRTS